MRKYLAYYETEWPANIAELTAVENKPFVGYLKGEGAKFTIIPAIQPNNEIWYTSKNGSVVTPYKTTEFWGANIVSNTYENGKGIIKFDRDVTGIGSDAFRQLHLLTSITIPSSVTYIGYRIFYDCSSLASVTIPEGLTSIKRYAFGNCSSLTSITIPNSVTSIDEGAFFGCSSITSMVVAEGNTVYDSRENCNALIHTATNALVAGCQNTIIPESVTSIGGYAFEGCTKLTAITIPNSITSIGGDAFKNCTKLTAITIPEKVTSIEEWAFCYCTSLTSITFEGTMEEWNNITKGMSWHESVPATHVQCSDGQVTL